MNRRDFLRVASILSGSAAASCELAKAPEKLIPYLVPPDDGIIPGTSHTVRSTCTECPAACGVDVKIMEGRPVKLEGNPDHPLNAGALCVRGQASIERLYQPARQPRPAVRASDGARLGVTWDDALGRVRAALAEARAAGRESVFLSGRTTGTLSPLIDDFCRETGVSRHPELELEHHGALRRANGLVFGRAEVPAYRLDRADVVVSFGADLIGTFGNPVAYGRQLSRRAESAPDGHQSGWFHVEPHLTLTGLRADVRLTIRPGRCATLLTYLLGQLSSRRALPAEVAAALPAVTLEETARETGLAADEITRLADALKRARTPLVMAGGVATAHADGLRVAVLAALIQWVTQAPGRSVDFAAAQMMDHVGTLTDADRLIERLDAGEIGVLFISRLAVIDHLPKLAAKLDRAQLCVALTDIPSPGLERCHLLLPLSHALESWGDARPQRDVTSIIQPVIEPLHDTRSEGDVLLTLMGRDTTYQQYLLARWGGADGAWLTRGVRTIAIDVRDTPMEPAGTAQALKATASAPADGLTLIVTASVRALDGRSQGLRLLSEIPDPLSAISYGEGIAVSPHDAIALGLFATDALARGQRAQLTIGDRTLETTVFRQMGLPKGVCTLSLALAATLAAKLDVASQGLDAVTGERIAVIPGVRIKGRPEPAPLSMLAGSTADAQERGILPPHADKAHGGHHPHGSPTLYPKHTHKDYTWGMVIDLDRCTGCSACVAACYIENNVPIVGPEEHAKGREMSWIRVQPYQYGDNLEFVPMMCQHCEAAPCEPVCPVYATYHNPEGLNAQVYNRCVGTRYCANNCPYKARRFNWLDHPNPAPLDKLVNPEVSVRPKGVMEKCTFCIQRIRAAKDHAKDEKRPVADGEFTTACAQTCPTGAITFGNLKDETSKVSKLAHSDRAYRVLEEVGTRPSVYYLKSPPSKKTRKG